MESTFWSYFFFLIVVNLALSAGVASLASRRGQNAVLAFITSAFATPIIGLAFVLLSPVRAQKISDITRREGLILCPFCAEPIKAEALVCKHCGRDVEDQIQKRLKAAEVEKTKAAAEVAAQSAREELRREEYRLAQEQDRKLRAERRQAFLKSTKGKILLWSSAATIFALIAYLTVAIPIIENAQREAAQVQAEADKAQAEADKAQAEADKAQLETEAQHTMDAVQAVLNSCQVDGAVSFGNNPAKVILRIDSEAFPNNQLLVCIISGLKGAKLLDESGYTEINSLLESGIDPIQYLEGSYYFYQSGSQLSYVVEQGGWLE